MRLTAASLALCISLLLSGCGGGSGGSSVGVTSTPPPPVTNTKLTDLQASQSFDNNAASTTVALDVSTGTSSSGTAARTSLTISYDAAARSYTVAQGGRSQTFGQTDVTLSDDVDTQFRKTDGSTNDYLTLVKTPYTGTAPTQYVGLGFWQRNTRNGSTQNTDFSVFTYGLPTSSSGLVRTGTAGYRVDAFGLVNAPGKEPLSFAGQGGLNVDLMAGVFSTQAYVTETSLVSSFGASGGGIVLTAAGKLSSGEAKFTGTALYEGWYGQAGGQIEGRFYGPAAEELGAAFSAANAGGMSVSGGFTGQKSAAVPSGNLTLTNLTRPQLFYTNFGGNLIGQLNWSAPDTFTASPPTSDLVGGAFTAADKVTGSDPNFTTYRKTFSGSSGSQDVTLKLYKPGTQNAELSLSYASLGHWATVIPFGGGTTPVDRYFAYGLETPTRLVSAMTGTATYAGKIHGTGVSSTATARYTVTGSSAFSVNFGSQQYSGTLTMAGTNQSGGPDQNFGTFDFAGPLSAYVATTSVPVNQNGAVVGSLETRFFGPDADEIAGPLYVNAGSVGSQVGISGVTAAKRQ